ncbi:MAG: hypothetical protein IPO08_09140 [Xanthomonadales bacterium]|nr:hypothetical protein [Xanthomonadales bacterium]
MIEVVYSEAMLAPNQGYSPSASKPAAVVAAWLAQYPQLRVIQPTPVSEVDFCRAHDPRFVEDIIDLRLPNGFGTYSREVVDSLFHTSSAMLTAARRALETHQPVAAPCSGFHHAGWDEARAFCTFNGLMVTALALQSEDPGLTIGILDYDYHYGDGTDDILGRLQSRNIVHVTAGAQWQAPQDAVAFLDHIQWDLELMARCDVVLYQAGADPHIDDPLGGFLNSAQMALRDWKVFSGLRSLGIPIAWNLAGGYQKPMSKVVALHASTMQMCIESLVASD